MQQAKTIRELGQAYSPSSDVGWQYTNEVTAGLALHTAKVSRLDVKPVALWDGGVGRGVGGTTSFVEFWHNHLKREVIIVEIPKTGAAPQSIRDSQERIERPTIHQQVKSMLFADIVGYSKLTESVIPEFIEIFMSRVSQLAASSKHAPRNVNTWGDAVYAVFDYAQDAGCFALELTSMIVEGKDEWLQKGLYWTEPGYEDHPPIKHPLSIRVGLHTGPVFMHYDPVVRKLGFTGAHVNRAARIEPIAKPGEVFASEEFVALAELDAEIFNRAADANRGGGNGGFACEYAGTMNLAKGYPGRFRIYRVVPHRLLVVDDLAKVVHDLYCAEAKSRGQTSETNSSICSWEHLPETLKEANRAQVADIPSKLRALGYEIAPGHGLPPSEIDMTAAQLEDLAVREHDRWMRDRRRNGWTYAPIRDNSRKHHPLLVPWEDLSDEAKELDRDAVRKVPVLLEKAGFCIRMV
ncbi:MAG: RyR domain-containing protein [Verrucomicrobiota bacterium]